MSLSKQMIRSIRIKVPATTANMGPGFDSIGMALSIYNEVEVREGTDDGEVLNVFCSGKKIHASQNHLIYKTIADFYGKAGKSIPPLTLLQEDNIPQTRGLGSSAACVAAGLIAANFLTGKNFSKAELINIAAQIEGHPDNTTPAFAGGMVVGAMTDGGLEYISIPRASLAKLKFAVMVPEFELATGKARAVLPKTYTQQDAVFNASRAALLTAALFSGEFDKLREAFDDRIHQPYRAEMIPGMKEILPKAKELGAYNAFLSGAGPTIIAVMGAGPAEKFLPAMREFLQTLRDKWDIKCIEPDFEGAKIF